MPPLEPTASSESNPLDAVLAVLLFALPFVALGMLALEIEMVAYAATGVMVVAVLTGAWMWIGAGSKSS